MNTTNTIVLSVVIVLLLSISVFLIELFIPISKKFEMNSICRKYLFIVEANGNLSAEEIEELTGSLEHIGLNDVSIEVDSDGSKFGDEVKFEVTAEFAHNSLANLFNRNIERMLIRYDRELTIRKIIN